MDTKLIERDLRVAFVKIHRLEDHIRVLDSSPARVKAPTTVSAPYTGSTSELTGEKDMIVLDRLTAWRRYCVGLAHELNRDGLPQVALEVQKLHIQLIKVTEGLEDFAIEGWDDDETPALKGLCPPPEDMMLTIHSDGSMEGDMSAESLMHSLNAIRRKHGIPTPETPSS